MSNDVGYRLQTIRILNGLSQRELAKRAGVTNSTISMIEQGRVSPSINSLQKVLDGIPMSLAEFFTIKLDKDLQVFYAVNELEAVNENGIRSRLLAVNQNDRSFTVKHTVFSSGTVTDMLICDGDEGGIVIDGQLEVTAAGQTRVLSKGEGFYFKCGLPHRFRNGSNKDCILVITTAYHP